MKIFVRHLDKCQSRRNKPAWECKSLGNLTTTSIVSVDECLRRHKEKLYKILGSISDESLEIISAV